ncbi:cobalamin import system permease protein BtuC [Candidatus Methanoplasma termitum]|uniref:BtuC1 protein n=1 Tax=Candidatus Methanoplasma termitum TaxID=1577791 RepID=A0A0A7LCX7_9ARCH|nr:iron chelate uptake ABC transporter family permease subunit [Candidatus Methanoplasma termitum]AIZ56122.1 cobalamin import system permease protein BtuC [Candidatus Methanoplasma termitum]
MNIRNNIRKAVLFAVSALLVITPLLVFAHNASADGSGGEGVLFDMGNGDTKWSDINSGGSINDVLYKTASDAGFSYSYSSSSKAITINGVTETTIGSKSTGGSMIRSGTTGVTVTSKWIAYQWDGSAKAWNVISDISAPYTGGYLALGFYPNGQTPVETPDNPSAWTMIRGDSLQTGAQDTTESDRQAEFKWTDTRPSSGVQASVLSANGCIFVKYNPSKLIPPATSAIGYLVCYTMDGKEQWEFSYPTMPVYDLSTPLIVGNNIYIPTSYGYIFKVPLTGPGDNNENVTTFGGKTYASLDIGSQQGAISSSTGATLTGTVYNNGPGSLVFDSGAIYFSSTNGMMYCFDVSLNLIWSSQMGGSAYFISQTVTDKYVFAGALNGGLYAIDKKNGSIVDQTIVYTRTVNGKDYGSVLAVAAFENNGIYTLAFGVSDGRGLNVLVGGVAIYTFDGSKLSKRSLNTSAFGVVANYVLPVTTESFEGIYVSASNGIFSVDLDGNYVLLNDKITTIRAPMVLVNGDSIYVQGYSINEPLYVLSLDGTIRSTFVAPKEGAANFSMAPALSMDGWVFLGNDSGVNAAYGTFQVYQGQNGSSGLPLIYIVAAILAAIILILIAVYVVLKYVKKEDKPFNYISRRIKHYLGGEDLRHNKRSKHRLWVVLAIGIILSVVVFFASLCIGYHATMSFGDMLHALFGAISNGGADPSNLDQIRVFESRLPRALAALGVGIGLSVAGSMYQAVIRNPLVDPYIMGVSSGAGTAAVAVIAFHFTFFGLFAANSIFTTAIVAMIGGLIAFAVTMFIAEKAGGTSINFVLAGVVVGLAFSSIQTLMMSMAGHEVSNALSWLFGSFANISWNQVWIILLPGLAMSLVPLLWAKELNLVLLGEDQAQQMGLNVRRFNRLILILASVLTSLCVAFVGIIGFVGLVIPHLCRMMLGGDHRLVLPASIAFGGALMMFADLASRTLYLGLELPVGAITTIIGVPVFAYLLIRRGKMYDG